VIVEFLEGDPDRPIVTGRVYNGECKPPYPLPDNKTMSTTKSVSSKGGGGFNEIRFEDLKGEEQIFIHAEKNHDVRVKNDAYEWVGHDAHLIVVNDQVEKIDHDLHQTIANDHVEEIGRDHHLKVKGKEAIEVADSHSLTVKGDCIEVFKANHSEETTSNYYLKAMQLVIEGTTGITLKCGGNSVVIDPAGVTVKGSIVTIDGSLVKIASGPGSSAGSGSAGSAVAPTAPKAPEAADTADPGEMAEVKTRQREQKKGKYGSVPLPPHKPPVTEEEEQKKTSWIAIKVVDEEGFPVAGEPYKVILPDETVAEGTTDDKGCARVNGIEPGSCTITFPKRDASAWTEKQ
jgi:type VI secretion system secreted protein VgrG